MERAIKYHVGPVIDTWETGAASTYDEGRFHVSIWRETGKWHRCARFYGDDEGEMLPEVKLVETFYGDSAEDAFNAVSEYLARIESL